MQYIYFILLKSPCNPIKKDIKEAVLETAANHLSEIKTK